MVNPDITAFLSFFDGWWASLQENALGGLVRTGLLQVREINPSSTKDGLDVIRVLSLLRRGLLASFLLCGSLWLGEFHEVEPASAIVFDSLLELDQLKSLLLTDSNTN